MFLIFDTETTGLPKSDNAPIEQLDNWPRVVQIAWQLHDKTGKLLQVENMVIRPDGYEIPYSAEKVHGISTALALETGIPAAEALGKFAEAIARSTFIIGHNVQFDLKITAAEFLRARIENKLLTTPTVCTMELTRDFCKLPGRGNRYKSPKLEELYSILFSESFAEAHNASADVNATARAFFELYRRRVIAPELMKIAPEDHKLFLEAHREQVQPFDIKIESVSADEHPKERAAEIVSESELSAQEVNFCHLHVHTQYSILDGAANIPVLISKAVDDGMKAIAITDHGNMFGVKEFHNEAVKRGIKPILGIEAYVAKRSRHSKEDKNLDGNDHLVLLAKSKKGYHNLLKLASKGWTEGFYYKPRIDFDLLKKYHEDIIVTTACLGGVIPQAIMHNTVDEAEKIMLQYKAIFHDDFYLELMRHPTEDPEMNRRVFEDQVYVNRTLVQLGKKHGIKCIATNDVHFINQEDAGAHDHLICLSTGKDLEDPNRMRYTHQEWFKTQDEMRELFGDVPEVLANTMEIAEKVEQYPLSSNPIMPIFSIPEEFENEDDYLRHITYKGAEMRWGTITDDIRERLDFELNTVKRMGFPGYFLIVQDFIAAAREIGVSVGPGRGSAAGSAVAYCLRITDIDPIRYDLLFERFLNPDRISMPDIDIDFDEDGRDQVLKWVVEKYGHDVVAHIITFGTMAAKMAIRDVARIQKLPLPEADRLAKLVPERPGTTLKKAFDEVEELRNEKNSTNPLVVNTLKFAETLEGSVRQTGLHACGIIIGRSDLTDNIPICTSKESELLVTQYDGKHVEDVGMLKMDFLGLKTLSIIKDTVENIRESTGKEIDIEHLPPDDQATFDLYARGDTTGLFQFESAGMKKHLRDLKPNRFEDLIAMNALYRPGPMEYIPSFIKRKHGSEKIQYDLPEMEEYLKDTYGITVYQEQVMLLSRKLAGFTGGQADSLRKAMGKKIRKMMDELKVKFTEGCQKNGYEKKTIEKIWKDWEAFAQYAFNKSHSTCYAYVSYQTAYLKAHYPAEFMAAVLSRNITDIKKIGLFMDECRRMEISVLGPCVNESNLKFTVNKDGNIRFGLNAIKGVGESAVEHLIKERKKNGKFLDIYDFVERNNLSSVNRKTLESLAIAGAFDSLGTITRRQYIDVEDNEATFVERLIKYGNKHQFERDTPQQNLFGEMSQGTIAKPEPPDIEDWHLLDKINREKELIGMYLTAHPLDRFKTEIDSFCTTNLHEMSDLKALSGRDFTFCGIVKTIRDTVDQWRNKPYLMAVVEDFTESYTVRLRGDDYVKFKHFFNPEIALLIRASVNEWRPRDEPGKVVYSLKVKHIDHLSEVREKTVKAIDLSIPLASVNENLINELEQHTVPSRGKILKINITDPETNLRVNLFSRNRQVDLTEEFIEYLNSIPEIEFRLV
ncbi:MAG: DNA polymerase III subunit alpha [Bacteroidales bacterium]|nr:DNA polymerase III subunit alpha [Bacteroidales bacterium]MDT8430227.1 DNA polymerase III subunit alpha [Bacteroidales bacterium]